MNFVRLVLQIIFRKLFYNRLRVAYAPKISNPKKLEKKHGTHETENRKIERKNSKIEVKKIKKSTAISSDAIPTEIRDVHFFKYIYEKGGWGR